MAAPPPRSAFRLSPEVARILVRPRRIRNIQVVRRTRWQRLRVAPRLFLGHFRLGKGRSVWGRLWLALCLTWCFLVTESRPAISREEIAR